MSRAGTGRSVHGGASVAGSLRGSASVASGACGGGSVASGFRGSASVAGTSPKGGASSMVSGFRGNASMSGSRYGASEAGSALGAEVELNRLEDVVLGKVQQRVPPRMSDENFIVKAFKFHDFGAGGLADFDGFRKALGPYISGIRDDHIRLMFDRYAPDGTLSYKEFAADFVSGYRRQRALGMFGSEAGASQAWGSPEEMLGKIQCHLYSQSPRVIVAFATSFMESDQGNARLVDKELFTSLLLEHFSPQTGHSLCEDQASDIFNLFQQMVPGTISYDEFFFSLKEDLNVERRDAVRAAFRRLDMNSEGLVDINHMIQSFCASRHPQVCEGARDPEEVLAEFSDTLRDAVAFRRGQTAFPTNLVAWEEFEDYYKLISGCFASDQVFCAVLNRVWDLDKAPDQSIDGRGALARQAAGVRAKARAGLHHWQSNTLPSSKTHHAIEEHVNVDSVLRNIRRQIASGGITRAVGVVRNFYAADDDLDDLLDVYEFRHACQQSGIALVASEEEACLEACGMVPSEGHQRGGQIQLQRFLRLLHGPLEPHRLSLIKKAFAAAGGDSQNEDNTLSPAVLKQKIRPEGHPLVVKGQMDPGVLLAEFLETFSLLAHIRGGCQDGMVSFSDFLAYYDLVSSTIDNDAFFDLLMHRLWPIPGDSEQSSPEQWGKPICDQSANPTARGRPPAHAGPTAYSKTAGAAAQSGPLVQDTHRRFARGAPSGLSEESGQQTITGFSSITKSSTVFSDAETGHLETVLRHLRESLARRGIKGWLLLSEKFQQLDQRRNGGIMRLDWQRLQKSLGLGLSPEEQDVLFKGFVNGRRDGAMDYRACMSQLRSPLSERRQQLVDRLFEDLVSISPGDVVSSAELKENFDAKSVPSCLVGKKTAATEAKDFCDAVDHFSAGKHFDHSFFSDLFAMVSCCYPNDGEFRLMTTAAFGLSASGPGVGGC